MNVTCLYSPRPRAVWYIVLPFVVIWSIVGQAALAQIEIVDRWKMTTRRPGAGWQQKEFDDSAWKEAWGGFGMRSTPGARVGTTWQTNNIWLRKSFELTSIPEKPGLLIHHDEDVQVFINGTKVADKSGYLTKYELLPLDDSQKDALQVGANLMAVRCRQTGGGQFIDVHLVDLDNVPELPPVQRSNKPFVSGLITKWGEEVTAENAWTEYPRPQMVRGQWDNLNGHWDYAVTSIDQTEIPTEWNGKILVPFCLESKLGGVQRLLDGDEALWYRRTFTGGAQTTARTMLNFEAVDYRCDVYVNGTHIGHHQGGHTPFSFDISEQVILEGENELVVRVTDETEGYQLRGKQVLEPRGIWYTQVSGIWQTVWMERVSSSYIEDLRISSDRERGSIRIKVVLDGDRMDPRFHVRLIDGEALLTEAQFEGDQIELLVPEPKLWTPKTPHLYSLEILLVDEQGLTVDAVQSYAAIRSVGKARDENGHLRMTLNGEPIFHWGPLDQGWWPDGLLTPPSDEAMLWEIEFLQAAGFNMIRKHIKVEPRRYYFHCDRLGMMVWQDQVSAGNNPPWTRLQPDPQDSEWPDEAHEQFMLELDRMIDTLENHPSIVMWVPFNEAWGQHRTMKVGEWMMRRDPSRLINIASGGNFWPIGDVVDAHRYPEPGFPFEPDRYDDFVKVVGEFGGHGFPVRDHLWDAERRNWGYGGLPKNESEYRQRYVDTLNQLNELRSQGIAGGVYTQTTDVEGEINGLMTYDRKVIKLSAEELAKLHEILFDDSK